MCRLGVRFLWHGRAEVYTVGGREGVSVCGGVGGKERGKGERGRRKIGRKEGRKEGVLRSRERKYKE